MTIDDTMLAAMRARCDAATKGPWCWENCGEKSNDYIVGIAIDNKTEKPISGEVPPDEFNESTGMFIETVIRKSALGGELMTAEDAAFIAHARTDLPLLLDAVTALREEREKLVEALRLVAQNDKTFYGYGGTSALNRENLRPKEGRWATPREIAEAALYDRDEALDAATRRTA